MAFLRLAIFPLLLLGLFGGTVVAQPKPQAGQQRMAAKSQEPRLSKEGVDFFESKIRPALVRNCYKCHSGDPAKAKGHFVLDTHDGLRKGGDSGEVISPRHPDKSLLIEALKYEGLEMPPNGKLSDDMIQDFVKWVEMGAPDPRVGKAANPKNKVDLEEAKKYWAFQPPRASPPPKVQDAKWPLTDIDRFILARLEKEDLKPVRNADPATLIRRLSFDLTGLPPTPDEIDAFVKDSSSGAYSSLVDRLLQSPRFGERWGRHWLDVVRYGESSGKERNIVYRYAWRYRNYVIDSFNADKPYSRFIVEQLAGDLLPSKTPAEHDNLVIATGLLAVGPKSADTKDPEQFKVDVIDDQIDVTGRAFLGMTIACARCHDHKFDPIPQTDYYAIAGIFHSTETVAGIVTNRKTAIESTLLKLTSPDQQVKLAADAEKERKRHEQEIAKIERQLDELHKEQRDANKKGPGPNAGKGAKGAGGPKVDQKELREEIVKLEERRDELEAQMPASADLAMGVRDSDSPADFHVLVRGELKEKGPDVPRGVLTVLKPAEASQFGPRHSGRLQLARWIADKDNPLTARVMVNRVWEHLLGQGIVDPVDNFGALGNDPSHPELLDTLAVQFMEQKWSIKKLIRSIVLSRVYQLSSEHDDHNYEKDPGNKFLWRMPRRRLDAEEIRDALLMASGQLDLQRPEGSPVMELPLQRIGPKGLQESRKPYTVRSVYLPMMRGLLPDMLEAFDMADPNLIVGKRDVTTVPTQALFLMNNPFVLKQSEEFARRIMKAEGLDQKGRIDLAYRIAVGRPPAEDERAEVLKFIADFRKSFDGANEKGNPQFAAWASFCQTLFESALFRYVY